MLLAACSSSTGPSVSELQQAVAQARISLAQSVATGEASVPDGLAIKAALVTGGIAEFSVSALGSGSLHDVRVDAMNGRVTSSRMLGASTDPCPGSTPITVAIANAEARVKGTAVSVQPDDDDRCLREVQVLSGSTLWEVKLARDGSVLEVEKADNDAN
jgi:hypothetical protein